MLGKEPSPRKGPGIRLAICVPCHDSMPVGTAYDLMQMMGALGLMCGQHPSALTEFGVFFKSKTYVPLARQELALKAWANDYTHVLWLDADMRFPADTPLRLLARNKDIVGINYSTRAIPPQFVAIKQVGTKDGKREALKCCTMPNSTGVEEVEALGFGAMLMRTSLFDRLHDPNGEKGPWFQTKYDLETGQNMGENVYFCRLARKAGARIYVDHDLSHSCAHVGQLEYTLEHAQDQFTLDTVMAEKEDE